MFRVGIAYLLWLFSGFGALGFHRLYLRKIPTGILWMCTGGLFGFGAIYDFFTLPRQVREANMRWAFFEQPFPEKRASYRNYAADSYSRAQNGEGAHLYKFRRPSSAPKEQKEHPERAILKLAKENNGVVTVSEVALAADISVDNAKEYLEKLVTKGMAELRVRNSGALVYVLLDFADGKELEDF